MSGLALNPGASAPSNPSTTSPQGGLLAVAAPAAQPAGPLADFAQAMLQQQPSLPLPGTLQPVAQEPVAESARPADAALDLLSGEHPQALAQQLAAALAAQPAGGEGAPADDKPAGELALDPQNVYALAALGLLNPAPQPAPEVATPAATAGPAAAGATPPPSLPQSMLLQDGPRPPASEASGDTAPLPTPEPGVLVLPELGVQRPAGESISTAALEPRLALKGEPRQWQQPLMQALGDRLQLEISTRSEQAVIRLDPPLLGRVEIAIRHQAGDLQVRIAASHGEVARQIQQVSDQLRQDLVQRHSGEVSVQISQGGLREGDARQAFREGGQQQQAQQEQQQQRRPGRGLADEAQSQVQDEGYGLAQALAAHT